MEYKHTRCLSDILKRLVNGFFYASLFNIRPIWAMGDFLREHSRMRTTLYPKSPSARVTFLSRFTFASILLRQNVLWVFGKWLLLQIRHPCQKHPSTNTATLYFGKTKSGCPTSLELRRHPVIPYSRNNATSLSSVLLFPFERILDIISERFFFDTVSILQYHMKPNNLPQAIAGSTVTGKSA